MGKAPVHCRAWWATCVAWLLWWIGRINFAVADWQFSAWLRWMACWGTREEVIAYQERLSQLLGALDDDAK
jgi:hypothetical protein